MEKQARDEWGITFNPTRDEDRDELQRISWPWSTACAWIAWQTFHGAASGVAAFRHWGGMIWREGREGDLDVRPERLMPMSKAERALRNALESGAIRATAIRGDINMPIPDGEWSRLAWEAAEHGEVTGFDHLTMLGVRRYSNVIIPRADMMRLWPALDGWAPSGSDVVDIDPADVREVRPVTEPALAYSPIERGGSSKAPLQGPSLRAFVLKHKPPPGKSKQGLYEWLQEKAQSEGRTVHRKSVRGLHGTDVYPDTAPRGRRRNPAD